MTEPQIKELTIMSMTKLVIYPNGQSFIKEKKSWIQGTTEFKKKVIPKKKIAEQIQLQEAEEY